MSERLKQLFDEAIALNQEAMGNWQHTLDLYKSALNELNATRAECERLRKALRKINFQSECRIAGSIAASALSPKEHDKGDLQ